MGVVMRECSLSKGRIMFTLNYSVFQLTGDVTQIPCNHSNWFTCEHHHLFKAPRQYKRENTTTNRNNKVNFRYQIMVGSILDSQSHEAHYTFSVSSAISRSSRVITLILISISSKNND